jgi:hypothetical protein
MNQAFYRRALRLHEIVLRSFRKDSWETVKPDNIDSSLCSIGTLLDVKTDEVRKDIGVAARKITRECIANSDNDEGDCTAEAKDLCECESCLKRYGKKIGASSKRQLEIDKEEKSWKKRIVNFNLK